MLVVCCEMNDVAPSMVDQRYALQTLDAPLNRDHRSGDDLWSNHSRRS